MNFAKVTHLRKTTTKVCLLFLCLSSLTPIVIQQAQSTSAHVNILANHSGYINDYGYFYVVGEAQNVGNDPAENVVVNATFYDSNGAFIATVPGHTKLDVLLPGKKSPFEITLFSSLYSQKVRNYTLSVSYSQAQPKPLGLEIISNSSYKDAEGLHVTGVIKNVGSAYTSFVKVVATFYNETGYVIAAKLNYSNPKNLNPGQSATFEILLNSSAASNVYSYALEAESTDYEMIPELNPISLLLIIVLTTATLSLQNKQRLKSSVNFRYRNRHKKFKQLSTVRA